MSVDICPILASAWGHPKHNLTSTNAQLDFYSKWGHDVANESIAKRPSSSSTRISPSLKKRLIAASLAVLSAYLLLTESTPGRSEARVDVSTLLPKWDGRASFARARPGLYCCYDGLPKTMHAI